VDTIRILEAIENFFVRQVKKLLTTGVKCFRIRLMR